MIRWKKEKPKYPDKIFAQRMKKRLEKKLLTLAGISEYSFLNLNSSQGSCPLLAQTEFLNIALECKIPLGNLGDALLSATRI